MNWVCNNIRTLNGEFAAEQYNFNFYTINSYTEQAFSSKLRGFPYNDISSLHWQELLDCESKYPSNRELFCFQKALRALTQTDYKLASLERILGWRILNLTELKSGHSLVPGKRKHFSFPTWPGNEASQGKPESLVKLCISACQHISCMHMDYSLISRLSSSDGNWSGIKATCIYVCQNQVWLSPPFMCQNVPWRLIMSHNVSWHLIRSHGVS